MDAKRPVKRQVNPLGVLVFTVSNSVWMIGSWWFFFAKFPLTAWGLLMMLSGLLFTLYLVYIIGGPVRLPSEGHGKFRVEIALITYKYQYIPPVAPP